MAASFTTDMLNVTAKPQYSDILTGFKYIAHHPLASTTYDYNEDIIFSVQSQNDSWLTCESYITIEGSITKAPAASDVTFVTYWGILHAFLECKYLLNGVEIDKTRGLGYAGNTM